MSTKTTGAELMHFFRDASIWPTTIWSEGERLKVNGTVFSGKPEALPDDAEICIMNGLILYNGPIESHPWKKVMLPTLEEYFVSWQTTQNT